MRDHMEPKGKSFVDREAMDDYNKFCRTDKTEKDMRETIKVFSEGTIVYMCREKYLEYIKDLNKIHEVCPHCNPESDEDETRI